MNEVLLDGRSLTRAQVVAVAREGAKITICADALVSVAQAAKLIADKVDAGEVVYGVTTGFGSNADKLLSNKEQAARLQRNLVITHAVGTGKALAPDVVRAMLLIRINTLLLGYSGIRPGTIEALAAMLNADVLPYIPEKGSVGASGDLAPLSHMALSLIGEGRAFHAGELLPSREALARAGVPIVELTYKEGLALINGTTLMLALLTLALADLGHALKLADLAAAMSTEALAGRFDAFRAEVHGLRPHPGQVASADNIRRLLEGSTLIDIPYAHIPLADGGWRWNAVAQRPEGGKAIKPQDSYSIRCMPQVHGAVRDAYTYAARVADIELNTVTDNPVVLPLTQEVISAGNFHGMPLAVAASLLKSVVPTLASISERRLNKLVDPATNDGLAPFLIKNQDNTHSGFMIVQYSAAALINDLASRAMPASVFSVPTSANTEDHVSMGANEARQLLEMMPDLLAVLGLELYTAAQALDVRLQLLAGTYWKGDAWLDAAPPEHRAALASHAASVRAARHTPGPAVAAAHAELRRHIPFMEHDRPMTAEVELICALARQPDLVRAAEAHAGSIDI